MSQKASVKRLWWKVDLLWGLFMRNTARRLPSIPTLHMTGVKMSLSQNLTNSSLADSKHRQSPVWFMLQSLYITESVSSATVCLCPRGRTYTPAMAECWCRQSVWSRGCQQTEDQGMKKLKSDFQTNVKCEWNWIVHFSVWRKHLWTFPSKHGNIFIILKGNFTLKVYSRG